MPRPDRSLNGAHEAMRQSPRPRRAPPPRATWSLPVTTVLRWAFALVLGVVVLSLFGSAVLDLLRGWLA